MTFSFCWLITWIFWLPSHKYSFRNQWNSFNISKWSFLRCWTKKVQEFRHIYIYSIVNVTSAAFIAPIPKIAILQLVSVMYSQRKCNLVVGWEACMPQWSQELCRQEIRLLVGPPMPDWLTGRGQTKSTSPIRGSGTRCPGRWNRQLI